MMYGKRSIIALLSLLLSILILLCGCEGILPDRDGGNDNNDGGYRDDGYVEDWPSNSQSAVPEGVFVDLSAYFPDVSDGVEVPYYSGTPYFVLNQNVPRFTDGEKTTVSYEFYSELDTLGRCGYTVSCVGKDLMPTEDRESISSVKPSGWINKKYDSSLVDGQYVYNRCHLIGFQLTGENANKYNLITGTRYMNVDGMLPFENLVADYVKETNNHVMYRVTPVFVGNELVARGVLLEGWSVEDEGDGVCFNVFVYNVQPGITIQYATGDNWLSTEAPSLGTDTAGNTSEPLEDGMREYVLNTSSKKFHLPKCSAVTDMNEANKATYIGHREDLTDAGYTPCGSCKP